MLVLGGAVAAADKPLADALASLPPAQQPGSGGKDSIPTLHTQLLTPLAATAAAGCSGGPAIATSGVSCALAAGVLTLRGVVHGLAYAHKREPLAAAVEELKVRRGAGQCGPCLRAAGHACMRRSHGPMPRHAMS